MSTILKTKFKKGIRARDQTDKRVSAREQLRRADRDETRANRRRLMVPTSDPATISKVNIVELVESLVKQTPSSSSGNLAVTRSIREFITIEGPPAALILGSKLITVFLDRIHRGVAVGEEMEEIMWCLVNISSGESALVKELVENRVLDVLGGFIGHPSDIVHECAVWTLANILGDGNPEYKGLLIGRNIHSQIMSNLDTMMSSPMRSPAIFRAYMFLTLNFIKPPGSLLDTLPLVTKAIMITEDVEALSDAISSFRYLMVEPNRQTVLDYMATEGKRLEFIARLRALILHDNHYVYASVIRILGHLTESHEHHTQVVIDADIVSTIQKRVGDPSLIARMNTALLISNIAGGTLHQSAYLTMKHPGVLVALLNQFWNEREVEVRREITWVFVNLLELNPRECIPTLLSLKSSLGERDVLGLIVESVNDYTETQLLIAILQAIDRTLHLGGLPVVQQIESSGFLKILERLQDHDNPVVYQLALSILKTYFDVECEEGEIK